MGFFSLFYYFLFLKNVNYIVVKKYLECFCKFFRSLYYYIWYKYNFVVFNFLVNIWVIEF